MIFWITLMQCKKPAGLNQPIFPPVHIAQHSPVNLNASVRHNGSISFTDFAGVQNRTNREIDKMTRTSTPAIRCTESGDGNLGTGSAGHRFVQPAFRFGRCPVYHLVDDSRIRMCRQVIDVPAAFFLFLPMAADSIHCPPSITPGVNVIAGIKGMGSQTTDMKGEAPADLDAYRVTAFKFGHRLILSSYLSRPIWRCTDGAGRKRSQPDSKFRGCVSVYGHGSPRIRPRASGPTWI